MRSSNHQTSIANCILKIRSAFSLNANAKPCALISSFPRFVMAYGRIDVYSVIGLRSVYRVRSVRVAASAALWQCRLPGVTPHRRELGHAKYVPQFHFFVSHFFEVPLPSYARWKVDASDWSSLNPKPKPKSKPNVLMVQELCRSNFRKPLSVADE